MLRVYEYMESTLESCSNMCLIPMALPIDPQTAEIYQCRQINGDYPPIINMASRTLAAPIKEQRFFWTPSQSIGIGFSPQVQDLQFRGLSVLLKR
jgi:hypothetical protein